MRGGRGTRRGTLMAKEGVLALPEIGLIQGQSWTWSEWIFSLRSHEAE